MGLLCMNVIDLSTCRIVVSIRISIYFNATSILHLRQHVIVSTDNVF